MNKTRINGIVSYLKKFRSEIGEGCDFLLKQANGNGFLKCMTWNTQIVKNIKQNQYIELLDYSVKQKKWKTKENESRETIVFEINEVELIRENFSSGWNIAIDDQEDNLIENSFEKEHNDLELVSLFDNEILND